MTDYLFHHNANTHWLYPTSEETDAIIDRAREAVADLINATPQEIAFGVALIRSATASRARSMMASVSSLVG